MNKTIWSEIWNRALREPHGVYLRVSDQTNARWHLLQSRPPWASDYRLHRAPDPQVLLLVAPGHGLYEADDARHLTLVRSDLEEPLP